MYRKISFSDHFNYYLSINYCSLYITNILLMTLYFYLLFIEDYKEKKDTIYYF